MQTAPRGIQRQAQNSLVREMLISALLPRKRMRILSTQADALSLLYHCMPVEVRWSDAGCWVCRSQCTRCRAAAVGNVINKTDKASRTARVSAATNLAAARCSRQALVFTRASLGSSSSVSMLSAVLRDTADAAGAPLPAADNPKTAP